MGFREALVSSIGVLFQAFKPFNVINNGHRSSCLDPEVHAASGAFCLHRDFTFSELMKNQVHTWNTS